MGITDSETIGLDSSTTGLAVLPTCCVGDTLSDRYRLDQEIGRGGMGIVFRAWDLELERPVAVKVLAAHLEGADARDRLFREARAAAALSHPHVVAVHDVGEHQNMPYFVMELVEGPSLRDRRPETLEETVELTTQICDALTHAHEHGLVHRDLKPANVLVEDRSGSLSIKIVDLGLATRGRGVRITREGGISGTVAYMAPEQALGREVDGRTDLYALGVMLYEFTTGRLDDAEQRIQDNLEATRKAGMPHWKAMTIKSRAQLHAARGDDDAATDDLDTAVEDLERLGSRIELGRTLVLRGRGDDLERARDLFQSCGAEGDLARLDG